MLLFSLGFRQALLAQLSSPDLLSSVFRVVGDFGHQLRVFDGVEKRMVTLAGRLDARPVVGDFVIVDDIVITEVIPRLNAVERRAVGGGETAQAFAANIDQVAIVAALNPAPNAGRIERGVTLAAAAGAVPLVILTKADIADDVDAVVETIAKLNPNGNVVAVAALSGVGLAMVEQHLTPGDTTLFIGASGAGKSTLLNALVGETVMATAEVREQDGKGRHTTTARSLIQLESGAMVVDTPGTRELGLWAEEADVETSFSDVTAFTKDCRFRDCSHLSEPGCGVLAALASGALTQARVASFHKQKREARFNMEKHDVHLRRERGRKFARVVADVTKLKRGE